jgi:hypothetical protein
VNPSAIAAMREVGIDIASEFPKPWADEVIRAADVVITMGCGDACPIFPDKRYEDWEVADPAGRDLEDVRPIRDDIERRVKELLGQLGVLTGEPRRDRHAGIVSCGARETRAPRPVTTDHDFRGWDGGPWRCWRRAMRGRPIATCASG